MSKLVTHTVRAGIGADEHHGAVVPPLHLSSTFSFSGLGEKRAYDYTRTSNPTREQLVSALAELEGGAGGAITASGMAAVTLVLQLLEPGQLCVAPHDCYGGTYRLLDALARRGAFELCFVDQTDDEALREALDRGPRLCWVETPSNPLLRVTDLARLVELARQSASARELPPPLIAADNTFLSPALQRPLDLGADIVIHSTTKYINGHSDVVGGAVVAKTPALVEELRWWANCLGLTGAPFDAFLTLRGLRTLHARVAAHERNAREIAARLEAHSAVARVHYPGLPSHPGHELAKRQQRGFGGMLSFELAQRAGSDEAENLEAVRRLVDGLEHFSLAASLGGVESLIAHPATITHAAMAPEARRRAGIADTLLRLSVGIEDVDDLWRDLEAGIERALSVTSESTPARRPPLYVVG